ncbi:beta-glucosidase [Streptomyces californicus]
MTAVDEARPATSPGARPETGTVLRFPAGFRWGTAPAACQIEGAAAEDGRAVHLGHLQPDPRPGANGDTGDVASDHHHRYPDDVPLLHELGVTPTASRSPGPVQPAGRARR